jgi:competence ComEA-like helix-hairpin-helix protein
MKNTTLIAMLLVCFLFVGFVGGFFLGSNTNHSDVQHAQKPTVTTESPGPKMNINTASAAQLQTLPGIGTVLAERIVIYRQEHGAFTTTEQLLLVEGIGDSLLDTLSELITIGG